MSLVVIRKIFTRQVVWLSDTDRRKGYAVDFLSVSLHAVSRDPEAYQDPCLYAQVESPFEMKIRSILFLLVEVLRFTLY